MTDATPQANWRAIKADILGRITRGDWPPGSALPAETDLAHSYGAARATVNRAMRELAAEGIIERKRKAGSRVLPAPLRQARFAIPVVAHDIAAQGADYGYRLLATTSGTGPGAIRARMGGPSALRHVLCLHSADARAYQVEDRWINLDLLPQARNADFSQAGPTEWLIAHFPYSEVEIAIHAVPADDVLARHLDCAQGAALLQVERLTRWQGQTVTLVRLTHAPLYRMTTRY